MENNMMGNSAGQSGGCCPPGVCRCPHHKFMPVLVILFGLAFLLQSLGVLSAGAVAVIWPIIVIVAGLAKWIGGACKCYTKHY